MDQTRPLLIVGLGNPGSEYDHTRHNVGFEIVERLAENLGLSFKREKQIKGHVASGNVEGRRVILIKPATFMNDSGKAVGSAVRYYKADLQDLLVVTDDVELKLGNIRLRSVGGTGGHNGLKSIRDCVGSNSYPRLRVGVGKQVVGHLRDYVLDRFSQEEVEPLRESVDLSVEVLLKWCESGFDAATQLLTAKLSLKNNRPHKSDNSE